MKRCCTCKETKELDAFNKDRSRSDGLRPQCKACKRAYCQENKDVISAYKKGYRQRNKERWGHGVQNDTCVKKYRITAEEYGKLLAKHNGKCGVCGTTEPKGPHNSWNLDHNHETGQVRDFLCKWCNVFVIAAIESGLVAKGQAYLAKHAKSATDPKTKRNAE